MDTFVSQDLALSHTRRHQHIEDTRIIVFFFFLGTWSVLPPIWYGLAWTFHRLDVLVPLVLSLQFDSLLLLRVHHPASILWMFQIVRTQCIHLLTDHIFPLCLHCLLQVVPASRLYLHRWANQLFIEWKLSLAGGRGRGMHACSCVSSIICSWTRFTSHSICWLHHAHIYSIQGEGERETTQQRCNKPSHTEYLGRQQQQQEQEEYIKLNFPLCLSVHIHRRHRHYHLSIGFALSVIITQLSSFSAPPPPLLASSSRQRIFFLWTFKIRLI